MQNMGLTESKGQYIKSVFNALTLLQYLSQRPDGESLTRISRDLGLDPASAHRMLSTLRVKGFVEQNTQTRKYHIGWNTRLLGIAALSSSSLFKEGQRHLKELNEKTGETANLVVREGWEGVYCLQVESNSALRVANKVGARVPLYCTACGKVLLAFMSEDLLRKYYDLVERVLLTRHTICSEEELEAQLREIRKTGMAYDWQEQALGETCMATPIMNIGGEVVAVISISAPANRLTRHNCEQFRAPLIETGLRLSKTLGFTRGEQYEISDGSIVHP